MTRIAVALLLGCTSTLCAQGAPKRVTDPAVNTSRALWIVMRDYVTRAAEMMPEADYAFKPTKDVRSFGEIIGHVAGSQYLFCAAALGEAPRTEDEVEKSTTAKVDLVAALRASSAYCEKAYTQSDAAAARMTTLFGEQQTRLYALGENATHDAEHYGNIVTYMRLKGMVPPSSMPSK